MSHGSVSHSNEGATIALFVKILSNVLIKQKSIVMIPYYIWIPHKRPVFCNVWRAADMLQNSSRLRLCRVGTSYFSLTMYSETNRVETASQSCQTELSHLQQRQHRLRYHELLNQVADLWLTEEERLMEPVHGFKMQLTNPSRIWFTPVLQLYVNWHKRV